MLPRRDSTLPSQGYVSPRSSSGSIGGRRPLSLRDSVTNQRTFHTATSNTEETEPPQPETSPQDISIAPPMTAPPMPPRPPPFPRLPPRNSGFRRQSVRPDTYESFSSAQDSPPQSQPPNMMPMPPLPSQSPIHPSTPKLLRPAFIQGVSRFAVHPPPRHGSHGGYLNQHTADYTYRFDAIPSSRPPNITPTNGSQGFAQSISNGQHREERREENQGGGRGVQQQANGLNQDILSFQEDRQARFYAKYRTVADEHEREFLQKYGEDLNTTLIFAGLFSAITSAFIIEVNSQLQPDPGNETAALLRVLIYEVNKTAFGGIAPTLPQWTGPPPTLIHVQAILFASLAISLLSAFTAMLGKPWLNRYTSADTRGSAIERCQNRQRKLDGIDMWYFDHVMESLPLMLQGALVLLSVAISWYLWNVSIAVASVVISITSFGLASYLFITVSGATSQSCPFQTPGSRVLRYLGPRVWRTTRSALSAIGPAITNTSKRIRVVGTIFSKADAHLGRTTIRTPSALPIRFHHLFHSTIKRLHDIFSTLRRKLGQETALPVFRCISWTIQTSMDQRTHLVAMELLEIITDLTGLDLTLVASCFNVFVGCLSFNGHQLMVMPESEKLVKVSASVLVDVRRRYNRIFPPMTDFRGLPFYHTMVVVHALAHARRRCKLQWHDYKPPPQDHILVARHLVKVARAKYQRMEPRKVPRWILRFALHSLSLDPPSPASVVADCLTIIGIDMNCDIQNLTSLNERARVDQVSHLITQMIKTMADAPSPTLLWFKHKAITALFSYAVLLEQGDQEDMVNAIFRAAGGSGFVFEWRHPGEGQHMRAWPTKAFSDSPDNISTSQMIQEGAILWSPQKLIHPTRSKTVVSTLALISSSPPYRFPKWAVVFLNLTLESLFREPPSQAQTDLAIDCLAVLGHIKYQSVVDRNWDQDRNVGGIPVTALVAWAAQQLTANAFDDSFNTRYPEEIRALLLTAAAWLSPVDATEEVTPGGGRLKIQDRWEFVEELRMTLARHISSENPLVDNKVLINLIHGMHACIPRGDYGSPSSIVSFLPLICDDYDSSWSEDESVLRALVTYALDLFLPSERRKSLVEREIDFDELASELIDALKVDTASLDLVAFGFWLIYRVPYAFRSRKTTLADIVQIWTSTNEVIPQDLRQRMNFHAVDAFVAVAQSHASVNRTLPKLATDSTLNLLRAALEDDYTRPMATYAVAMILDLGTSSQAAPFARGFDAGSFANTLDTVKSDLEKNTTEEDAVDLHIYSTLALLNLRQPQVDAEKVKTLIEELEKTIGDPIARDSGIVRDSKTEINVDLDRVKWKAIYLCGLLIRFPPPGQWEGPIERVRERVRALLRTGELLLASDYERCIEPLDIGVLELRTPAEQGGPMYAVFEEWVEGFPFRPLVGSVSDRS